MPEILVWPAWFIVVFICIVAFLILIPFWAWSASRRRIQSLRREVMLWRSEKLLQSPLPLDLEITGIKRKDWMLRFSEQHVSYVGRKRKWLIPFVKIKSWRVFDQNRHPDFVNSGPQIWNLELKDSGLTYLLDSEFVNDSEADQLIRSACVRAFGANESTSLEGLRMELARSERLLHEINSGNINRKQ